MSIRSIALASACAVACLLPSYGQNNATFTPKNTPTTAPTLRNTYTVDVNNDGIPDIIMDRIAGQGFSIFISNGDGTFHAGYSYTFPSTYQGTVPMASGDFNGDGKVDLVFQMAGTDQLAVFLGNGDGTFQGPTYETIALPTGQHFGGSPMVAADFTGDGKLDLVTESNTDSQSAMILIPGQGNGQFSAAKVFYTPPANDGVGDQIGIGDFDGDGHADVAFLVTYNCTPGNCSSIVHVDYGDGAGNFTDTTSYSSGSTFQFATGDLNDDSRTDIFGFSGSELVTLYGQANRTLALYGQANGVPATSVLLGLAMADFNGDGIMDLVGVSEDTSNNSALEVYYGTSSPGFFRHQSIATAGVGAPMVGDFNRDTKPDVAYVISAYTANNPPPNIVVELNSTSAGAWGDCAYAAKGMGINVCAPPSTTTSPAQFLATANSYGQLRKIELWVDGKKIGEQWHAWGQRAWFGMSSSFAAGTHNATVYAGDVDNRLQKLNFSFTVGSSGACTPPTAAGVHVCSPANGSTVSSPVQASAAATVTGTISRMEVWVDGVKKYSTYGSRTLNTSIALAAGSHRFSYYAVNTAGAKWETTVYATVK